MRLRDQLRARELATEPVAIAADPRAWAAAELELDTAHAALQRLPATADPGAAQERVRAAQAALDALPRLVFTIGNLSADDWDALVGEHQPTDEQRAAGWTWNVTTFRPALLCRVAMGEDGHPALTEREWEEVSREGQMTPGELDLLFVTAVNRNMGQPQVSVGKGSAATGN